MRAAPGPATQVRPRSLRRPGRTVPTRVSGWTGDLGHWSGTGLLEERDGRHCGGHRAGGAQHADHPGRPRWPVGSKADLCRTGLARKQGCWKSPRVDHPGLVPIFRRVTSAGVDRTARPRRWPFGSGANATACAGRHRAPSIPTSTTCMPVTPRAARMPCGCGASCGTSAFRYPEAGRALARRAAHAPGPDDDPVVARTARRLQDHRSPRCPRRSRCRGIARSTLTTSMPRPPLWSRGSRGRRGVQGRRTRPAVPPDRPTPPR